MNWLWLVGVGVVLMTFSEKMQPRGLRNNNPLNIRWDGYTAWEGMTGVDSDGFIIFKSKEYGYRAATKILLTYSRRGVVTLSDIISTWAPPSENDTENYIAWVSGRLGVEPGAQIGTDMYPKLLAAMERMEVGKYPSDFDEVLSGVNLAYA